MTDLAEFPPGRVMVQLEPSRNSVQKRRRCIDGFNHSMERATGLYEGKSDDMCRTCGDVRRRVNCWWLECGEDADRVFIQDMPDGTTVTQRGTCGYCVEGYNRERAYQRRRFDESLQHERYVAHYIEQDRLKEERNQQWQQNVSREREVKRQRELLRQGQQTLSAIRRHLRGADRLPQKASEPEKTSPI